MIICDIKGAELGLFDKVNLNKVRTIILEVHPAVYGEEGTASIVNILMNKGYTIIPKVKRSSVWHFERMPAAAAPGLMNEQAVDKPQLELAAKPWNDVDPRVMISTCMKNEGPFILEWIAWHKAIGITDIVVFSNDCTDGTDLLLDRLQDMGMIQHLPNPAIIFNRPDFQPVALAYTPQLASFKRADFYISMDVDEFINIKHGDGNYDHVVLEHYPLRSLNSYFVKMHCGDVVVKDKMVSQRYWRVRNGNEQNTTSLERQQEAFKAAYASLMEDKQLQELHIACCEAHEARIAELLTDPSYQERKRWIFDECW